MNIGRIPVWILFIAFTLLLGACSSSRAAEGDSPGVSFTMTMAAPGQDLVTFEGIALGENCRLSGMVGGIETVTLLTGGKLYSLTPAIRTVREIDLPQPPSNDSAAWPDWLIEPGRVNPISFAETAGVADDFDGNTAVGRDDNIEMSFSDGRLISISFPSLRGDGIITYTYSGFDTDADITSSDFQVPEGYTSLD